MTISSLPLPMEILRLACERFGYGFELLDEFTGYLAEVSDGGGSSFLSGTGGLSPFPLNLFTPHRVAGDKAHTRTLLQKRGVRVARGSHFFLKEDYRCFRPDGREIGDALGFADELGYPCFVKPNNGSFGIGCEIVYSRDELRQHLEFLSKTAQIALVEEVLEGAEFRIFVLDGEVKFAYGRGLQRVVGDGVKSVSELLDDFNSWIVSPRGKVLESSLFLRRRLNDAGLSFDAILEVGCEFVVSPRANVTTGGEIGFYAEEVSEGVREWVRGIADITHLRVFGVDVFADDLNDPGSFTVLEVNSNPGLNGVWELGKKDMVFGIWGEVFGKIFGER